MNFRSHPSESCKEGLCFVKVMLQLSCSTHVPIVTVAREDTGSFAPRQTDVALSSSAPVAGVGCWHGWHGLYCWWVDVRAHWLRVWSTLWHRVQYYVVSHPFPRPVMVAACL